jgi:hypothetical protein
MGIRQPGFQLLSLSSEASAHTHQPCLLPDQVHIYCWVYAPLVLATIVLATARALTTAPSCYQKHTQKRSLELTAISHVVTATTTRSPMQAKLPIEDGRRSVGYHVATAGRLHGHRFHCALVTRSAIYLAFKHILLKSISSLHTMSCRLSRHIQK